MDFFLGLAGGRDDGLLRLRFFFSKFVWVFVHYKSRIQ